MACLSNMGDVVVAMHDYEARDETELGFLKGEIFWMTSRDAGGSWATGRTKDGQTGMFPIAFIEMYDGPPPEMDDGSDSKDKKEKSGFKRMSLRFRNNQKLDRGAKERATTVSGGGDAMSADYLKQQFAKMQEEEEKKKLKAQKKAAKKEEKQKRKGTKGADASPTPAPAAAETIYGMSIEDTIQKYGGPLPPIIKGPVEFLEANSLNEEGLFRISGIASHLKELGEMFFRNDTIPFSEWDCNAVSGSLKKYFRELPKPLFTCEAHEDFLAILNMDTVENKVARSKEVLAGLPEPNRNIIEFLFPFLQKVHLNSEVNKMTPNNLGIVFGPTLMRSKEEDASGFTNPMGRAKEYMAFLIEHADKVFEGSAAAAGAGGDAAENEGAEAGGDEADVGSEGADGNSMFLSTQTEDSEPDLDSEGAEEAPAPRAIHGHVPGSNPMISELAASQAKRRAAAAGGDSPAPAPAPAPAPLPEEASPPPVVRTDSNDSFGFGGDLDEAPVIAPASDSFADSPFANSFSDLSAGPPQFSFGASLPPLGDTAAPAIPGLTPLGGAAPTIPGLGGGAPAPAIPGLGGFDGSAPSFSFGDASAETSSPPQFSAPSFDGSMSAGSASPPLSGGQFSEPLADDTEDQAGLDVGEDMDDEMFAVEAAAPAPAPSAAEPVDKKDAFKSSLEKRLSMGGAMRMPGMGGGMPPLRRNSNTPAPEAAPAAAAEPAVAAAPAGDSQMFAGAAASRGAPAKQTFDDGLDDIDDDISDLSLGNLSLASASGSGAAAAPPPVVRDDDAPPIPSKPAHMEVGADQGPPVHRQNQPAMGQQGPQGGEQAAAAGQQQQGMSPGQQQGMTPQQQMMRQQQQQRSSGQMQMPQMPQIRFPPGLTRIQQQEYLRRAKIQWQHKMRQRQQQEMQRRQYEMLQRQKQQQILQRQQQALAARKATALAAGIPVPTTAQAQQGGAQAQQRQQQQRQQQQQQQQQQAPQQAPQPQQQAAGERGVALYDFKGDPSKRQLSLQKGQEVLITKKHQSGWWLASSSNGNGLVPSNFIRITGPQ